MSAPPYRSNALFESEKTPSMALSGVENTLAFEDFSAGDVFTLGPATVSEADILGFAQAFDPQPFHTDPQAAKTSMLGGLVASGWHTGSLFMRMMAESFILASTGMGAPGMKALSWPAPVRPGDTLHGRSTVQSTRASNSRPDRGIVFFSHEVFVGETLVMNLETPIFFARKDASTERPRRGAGRLGLASGYTAADLITDEDVHLDPAAATQATTQAGILAAFEDIAIGAVLPLGHYTFSEDAIIHFARLFDPQPFHIDPHAAAASAFGGLCASGWHTAAVWMRLTIDTVKAVTRQAASTKDGTSAEWGLGPSPGFSELQWLKPVFAGDTIRFSSVVTAKRISKSRPEWGLVSSRNVGTNQHGEDVFVLDAIAFARRASVDAS